MKLRFDYNNMMTSAIGSHGIAPSVIDKAQKAHVAAFKEVIDNSGKGWQEWCDLPFNQNEIVEEMLAYCGEIGKKADSMKDGIALAAKIIDSGKALDTLRRFIEASNRPGGAQEVPILNCPSGAPEASIPNCPTGSLKTPVLNCPGGALETPVLNCPGDASKTQSANKTEVES